MYYKVSPVLIILVTLVLLLLVGLVSYKVSVGKNNVDINNEIMAETNEFVPNLDLSLDTEEEGQESVTIIAKATTDDIAGIDSITLPNGAIEKSDVAEYIVDKNGNYTFKVKGKNNQTSSLTIEVNNIRGASPVEPYIPTGFSHIEGEVDEGFVIQDSYGNEFVWVPVPTGKVTRNTALDSNYEENNSTASGLVNSVSENYGFYIARYEACSLDVDGQSVAGSMPNKTPWVHINYSDAAEASMNVASVFGYEGYQTAIMNSYAWDTTLSWLDTNIKGYSSSTEYGNYSGETKETSATETDIKNNICDMAGNVREWTTEIYKNKSNQMTNTTNTTNTTEKNGNITNEVIPQKTTIERVIRGGSANLNRTASSHTGYAEDSTDDYWGFRMILYK